VGLEDRDVSWRQRELSEQKHGCMRRKRDSEGKRAIERVDVEVAAVRAVAESVIRAEPTDDDERDRCERPRARTPRRQVKGQRVRRDVG